MNIDEWERWRGGLDAQMKDHANHLNEHCQEIEGLKKSVNEIMQKIAVPLFITSLIGVILGGVIVAMITNATK